MFVQTSWLYFESTYLQMEYSELSQTSEMELLEKIVHS